MEHPERKRTVWRRARHLRASTAVLAGVAAAACADSKPTASPVPSAPAPEQMEPGDTRAEAALELNVEGRSEPLKAQARLQVVEGDREVTLTITGGDAADNLVLIDLGFDGVEAVMGDHSVQLGPPEAEGPYAVAILERQEYHSPSGEVELSLSRDGAIEGSFDVALLQTGAAEAAAPVTALRGSFAGSWIVSCRSPIRGFTGGHTVSDSPYCNSLEF